MCKIGEEPRESSPESNEPSLTYGRGNYLPPHSEASLKTFFIFLFYFFAVVLGKQLLGFVNHSLCVWGRNKEKVFQSTIHRRNANKSLKLARNLHVKELDSFLWYTTRSMRVLSGLRTNGNGFCGFMMTCRQKTKSNPVASILVMQPQPLKSSRLRGRCLADV